MGSSKIKFRGSVKLVQIVHSFTHVGGHVKNGDSSDSGSETEPLCHEEEGPNMTGHARLSKSRTGGGWRLPSDIRHGYMAVYVGKEKKRFVISTHFLSHRLFKSLLKRSEEEFGFVYQGGLAIACEPVLFEHLLWIIGNDDPSAQTTELNDLMESYDEQHLHH